MLQTHNKKSKVFLGNIKVKKAYIGSRRVYSAGNIATYYVDTGKVYSEEVDSDASCLSPTTFTPTKSGWTFVGWREDKTANSSVLSKKIMDDESVTLYAVFKQNVSVNWYSSSATAFETKQRYYNNGNIANPSFSRTISAISGWNIIGWSTNATTDDTYDYRSGGTFTRDSSVNLYAKYNRAITVTYYDNSASAKYVYGTRYYTPHNGNYNDPSFEMWQSIFDGWEALGWATESTAADNPIVYNNGEIIKPSENLTLYGRYRQSVTLTCVANGSSVQHNQYKHYNAPDKYDSALFTVPNPSKSGATFLGWSVTAGNSTVTYNTFSNVEVNSNKTLYAVYTYNDVTLKSSSEVVYQHQSFEDATLSHTILSGIDGTKYSSLSVTVRAWELVCAQWAAACHAYTNLKVMSGSTEVSAKCLRYVCTWLIYTPEGQEAEQDEQSGYPCTNGATATVTLGLNNTTGQSLKLMYETDVFEASTSVYAITAKGRTVVG